MVGRIAGILAAGGTVFVYASVTDIVSAVKQIVITAKTEIFAANITRVVASAIAGVVTALKYRVISATKIPTAYRTHIVFISVAYSAATAVADGVSASVTEISAAEAALLVIAILTSVVSTRKL